MRQEFLWSLKLFPKVYGKQSCTSHVCLDLNDPVKSVWLSILFFESLVFPCCAHNLFESPHQVIPFADASENCQLVNTTGICTSFPKPDGLVQVVPVEIYNYMCKLTQVTVIVILKIRGLKMVFVAVCMWTSSKVVSSLWQGLLDVTGLPGFLLVMLSSAIKQQEEFTYLAACLLLETDNLFRVENVLVVLIDQRVFYSSIPNESLFCFYIF